MPFAFRVERADPGKAVGAAFAIEVSVRHGPFDLIGHFGDPHFRAMAAADFFDLPFPAFEEIEVHAVDHFRPVVGLGAPGPRLDGEEAVSVVMLARKQALQLDLFHVLLERVQRLIGFG